jgi:hypothetical protein
MGGGLRDDIRGGRECTPVSSLSSRNNEIGWAIPAKGGRGEPHRLQGRANISGDDP